MTTVALPCIPLCGMPVGVWDVGTHKTSETNPMGYGRLYGKRSCRCYSYIKLQPFYMVIRSYS